MDSSRRLNLTVAMCALVIIFCPATHAQYGGGSGWPNDPYLIYTAEQLNTIGTDPDNWDKHFKLMADIDLAAYTGDAFNTIGYGPTNQKHFAGVFDGNGHTISNFSYRSAGGGYAGLFAYVGGPDAEIKNLGLVDPAIDATSGECVGSLVGCLGEGILTNCYAKGGTVSGGVYVGGLVGSSVGAITHCYATGHVAGRRRVGGLLGSNAITITRGGSGPRMGRVIGSCSSGNVTGHEEVGGLVGYNAGIVTDCYATGSVVGEARIAGPVGGLVGHDSGTIRNCYSTGAVAGNVHVGGLVGYGSRYVASSFWDVETSGQESSAGGEGKTTVQMQITSTFYAWVECGQEAPWTIDEGRDYPRLSWENRPGEPIVAPPLRDLLAGTGTEEDPYLIYAAQDLILIGLGLCDWDKHFKLMADIDLSEHPGDALKTMGLDQQSPFRGVFDGNGHAIVNLSMRTHASYCGLFGCVDDPNAEIKNLALIHANIDAGTASDVGALVGYLGSGRITNCCVEASVVSGWICVGGLVGRNGGGVLANCCSSSDVSGYSHAGALVGYSHGGVLVNCYASGTTAAEKKVGGLVGENTATIVNSYSSTAVAGGAATGGLVGSGFCNNVVGSFWDIETSGWLESAGGTGKTTEQMQTAATFFSWNACGNEGTWTIDEGTDYPRLWWQRRPGDIMPASQLQDLVTGAGTEDTPFLIYTAEELNLIGLYPCQWQGHFKLMADIDLSGYTASQFNIIGQVDMPFGGVFDGNGHRIANFTYVCPSADSLGLFGCVAGPGAVIRDLALIDASVRHGGRSGALVGYLRDATLTRCSSTGTVAGNNLVGGLVGYSDGGTVDHCYSAGTVTAKYMTGGLVGYSSAGTITGSHSAGTVAGNSDTGGLVGCSTDSGMIIDCYSISAVKGKYDTGGLSGTNRGLVTRCYSYGTVAGAQDTGGLLGSNAGFVTQCYSAAIVSGSGDYVGGLVGRNGDKITHCYASGSVTGGTDTGGLLGFNSGKVTYCYSTGIVAGGDRSGGLVGHTYEDTVRASFWDIETSGQTTSDGGRGRTTAEMQTAYIYLMACWDFVDETRNGKQDVWWILEGQDYPRLWWERGGEPPL